MFRLLELSSFFEGSQNDVRRLSFFPGRVAIAGPQGSGKRDCIPKGPCTQNRDPLRVPLRDTLRVPIRAL